MGDSVDLEEDFIEMPFIHGQSATSSQTGDIQFAKFIAPASNRFIAEPYTPSGHQRPVMTSPPPASSSSFGESVLTDRVLDELRKQSANGCLLCSFDALDAEELD